MIQDDYLRLIDEHVRECENKISQLAALRDQANMDFELIAHCDDLIPALMDEVNIFKAAYKDIESKDWGKKAEENTKHHLRVI